MNVEMLGILRKDRHIFDISVLLKYYDRNCYTLSMTSLIVGFLKTERQILDFTIAYLKKDI